MSLSYLSNYPNKHLNIPFTPVKQDISGRHCDRDDRAEIRGVTVTAIRGGLRLVSFLNESYYLKWITYRKVPIYG